jgi:hypothetical protein
MPVSIPTGKPIAGLCVPGLFPGTCEDDGVRLGTHRSRLEERKAGGAVLSPAHSLPRLWKSFEPRLVKLCHACESSHWGSRRRPPRMSDGGARTEQMDSHLLLLTDGTVYPITAVGDFTLRRLRLNRPALVTFRLSRRPHADEQRLLAQYRDLLTSLEHLSWTRYPKMPLLDHFHPPVSERRRWEGFHGLWAAALVEKLNQDVLADEYFADMQVHTGAYWESGRDRRRRAGGGQRAHGAAPQRRGE